MGTRAYLRPEARRRQLLDAASRLFDRGGFTAVTMSAVAAEAGASRRLVYDHFADLATLYEAFFDDRVARYATAIDAASTGGDGPAARSIGGAVRELLAIPPEDLRPLHLLLADGATPELAGARERLRSHLQARWLPALAPLGLDRATADALLWTLASSFVTLAEARPARRARPVVRRRARRRPSSPRCPTWSGA
ncbi:MAG: TetR/AcrR family transcriptional regulator [Acidimicrobiales bacterium]